MPRVQVEKIHGPARRKIIKGLVAFNKKAVVKPDYSLLTVTLRDGKDIVGVWRARFGWIGFLSMYSGSPRNIAVSGTVQR
jgi:hypothetical protein